MNTWLWSNAGNRATESASRIMGGPAGGILYRWFNFSPWVLLRSAYADKSRLTPGIHRHYLAPFADRQQRFAPWVLARELTGSNDWYDQLWQQRSALESKPALLLWGMRDPLIPAAHLERWQEALPQATVRRVEDAGHFLQEEAAGEVTDSIREFLEPAGGEAWPAT